MDNLSPLYSALKSVERRRLLRADTFCCASYAIFLIEQGGMEIRSGSVCTDAACAAFLPDARITLTPDGSCEYILLRLAPETVLHYSGRRDLLTVPLPGLSARSELGLRECLREILTSFGDPSDAARLGLSSLVLRVLELLVRELPRTEPDLAPLIPLRGRRAVLYSSVRQYLRRHAEENPSLKETAACFHITPQYLGALLKECSALTFRALIQAEREKNRSLITARAAGAPEEEAPGTLLHATAQREIDSPAVETAQYRVQAGIEPVSPLPQFFRTLINLGYAANLRSLDLDNALDRTQREIGFRCGRICRITDLITTGSIHGRSYYDFSAVFSLLDRLIARDITPFLELGNKSFLIQETTVISYAPVSPTDTKAYYRELLEILPEFARASINHYGQSEFDSWYFEISFMYTSDEEREKFGLVQYAGMFRKIYTVLRSFSPSCRIGGPGFNDWSDPSKIRQMIRLISSHGVVPDFFSAYVYPMTTGDSDTMHLSQDPDEGLKRIRTFAETVQKEYPHHEVWITEFNSNLSSRNYLNDAGYQAAYIARMMFGAMPLHISAIGYYLLSDAPLRYLDSLEFLFGGWGLLTDRGIPKPSFHAYHLMSRLGHYRISLTDSCLVTANSQGSFQILLYRYQHPGDRYCYDNVEREDLAAPAKVFGPGGVSHFHIRIDRVLKGTYLMREYHISDTEANVYSAWQELGYLYPPNIAALKELELKSALIPRTRVLRLDGNEPFEIEIRLRGLELVLITVDLYASHI